MSRFYGWKNMATGKLEVGTERYHAATREELWRKTVGRDSTPGELERPYGNYVIVSVVKLDGKWVEAPTESEPDRLWRLVCEASST
jgi:hypothetical protein